MEREQLQWRIILQLPTPARTHKLSYLVIPLVGLYPTDRLLVRWKGCTHKVIRCTGICNCKRRYPPRGEWLNLSTHRMATLSPLQGSGEGLGARSEAISKVDGVRQKRDAKNVCSIHIYMYIYVCVCVHTIASRCIEDF